MNKSMEKIDFSSDDFAGFSDGDAAQDSPGAPCHHGWAGYRYGGAAQRRSEDFPHRRPRGKS